MRSASRLTLLFALFAGIFACSGLQFPPALTKVSPSEVIVGAPDFTATLTGTYFDSHTTVLVNGVPFPSTLVSESQISLVIPATYVASTGRLEITVWRNAANSNPAPVPSTLQLAILNPTPVLTSVSPERLPQGIASTAVTLTGKGFVPGSEVLFDGSIRSSHPLDSTHVLLNLTAADLSVGATHTLQMHNEMPGGGTSQPLPLSVLNPPPTEVSISPESLILPANTASVTMTGSGFLPVTTLSVDGTNRAFHLLDAEHLSFDLTPADLEYATHHEISVANPPPGGGAGVPLALVLHNPRKNVARFSSFGDSITLGYTVPQDQAFPALIASSVGLPLKNDAEAGEQACDLFPGQIRFSRDGERDTSPRAATLMVGSNDLLVKGVRPYQTNFTLCHQAAIAWLATPENAKVLPADARMVGFAGCDVIPDGQYLDSKFCVGAGSVTISSYHTEGHPLYVWYVVDDDAAAGTSFVFTVDGVDQPRTEVVRTPRIQTANGRTMSLGLLRIPVGAGDHTLVLQASGGGVALRAVGSVPQDTASLPFVVVGDIPSQAVKNARNSVADQQVYEALTKADVDALRADGLDLRWVPTREFMLGASDEMADFVHPNALGQQHLMKAFHTGFADAQVVPDK